MFPTSRERLRIVDINVWSGLNYRGTLMMGEYENEQRRQRRYRALTQQLRELNPDIIGIHEANKLPDYAETLAADLNYDVHHHVGVGGVRLGPVGLPWNLREGDAILTRPDLQAKFVGRKQLSGGHVGNFFTFHFGDATQILAVKITNRGQGIFIFATHWHASPLATAQTNKLLEQARLSGKLKQQTETTWTDKVQSGASWRMRESEATIQFIHETAGNALFILMGDFNATENLPEIENLLAAGLVDSYRALHPTDSGYTWDPRRNLNYKRYYAPEQAAEKDHSLLSDLQHAHESAPKRIDYIFVGPREQLQPYGMSIISSRIVLDEIVDGVHTSDHFGIMTEIAFRN